MAYLRDHFAECTRGIVFSLLILVYGGSAALNKVFALVAAGDPESVSRVQRVPPCQVPTEQEILT